MASFTDTIKVVFETTTSKASSDIKNLSSEFNNAEGAANKAKAGFSGIGTVISGSSALAAGAIGGMALGAGKALADMVGHYTSAASAVDDFRVASGLSAEEASRWASVADQMGMSTEDLQGAFGKLAQNLGKNPELLSQFGIQAARAKDGSIDLGTTLLAVTDKMADYQDPVAQATLGTAAFGKSWQKLIPIIDNGSAKVKELAKNTATVFSQKDLDNAEKFDQSMAKLGTRWEKIKNEAGGTIVEEANRALGDLNLGETAFQERRRLKAEYAAAGVGDIAAIYDEMAKHAKELAEDDAAAAEDEARAVEARTKAYEGSVKVLEDEADARRILAGINLDATKNQAELTAAVDEANKAAGDAAKARGKNNELNEKANELTSKAVELAAKQADTLTDQAKATAAASGTTISAQRAQDVWNQSMLTTVSTMKGPVKAAQLDYIATVNGVPTERVTEFKSLVNSGQLEAARALLNDVAVQRKVEMYAEVNKVSLDLARALFSQTVLVPLKPVASVGTSGTIKNTNIGIAASGGHFGPGELFMVGETNQPEIVRTPTGTSIVSSPTFMAGPADVTGVAKTASALAGGSSSGAYHVTNNYVTQNYPAGTDPRGVAAANRLYERRNGLSA